MKILIFSDSHGVYSAMRNVLETHMRTAPPDAVFHLGDGMREFRLLAEAYSPLPFIGVRGNSDVDAEAPYECILEMEGCRMLLTHGHLHGVKAGYERIAAYGREKGVDIVLFGHTHGAYSEYIPAEDGSLRLFCPGSIGLPVCGKPAYGVMDIRKHGGILLSNAEIAEMGRDNR